MIQGDVLGAQPFGLLGILDVEYLVARSSVILVQRCEEDCGFPLRGESGSI